MSQAATSPRQPPPKDDAPAPPAANYVSPLAVSSGQVRPNYKRKAGESPGVADTHLPKLGKGSLSQSQGNLQASRRPGSLRESASEPLLGAKARQPHRGGKGSSPQHAGGGRLSLTLGAARGGDQLPDVPSPTADKWLSPDRKHSTDLVLPDLRGSTPTYFFVGTPEEKVRRQPKPAVEIPQMTFLEAAAIGRRHIRERKRREKEGLPPKDLVLPPKEVTLARPAPLPPVELPPTEETVALREISSAVTVMHRGLDGVVSKYERRLESLRPREELMQRATYEVTYGDPIYARALKVAAQASAVSEAALRRPPKTSEAPALEAISLLSQKVTQEMSRLQQEGWAVGVLEALRDEEKLAEEDAAKEDAEGEGEELAMTQKLPEAEEEQQEQPADDEQPGSEPGSPGSPKRMLVRMETFSDELVAHGDVSPEDDTNLDVPRLQEAFYHFKVPDSFDIDVNDLAEVMHHLGHIKMTKEEALEIAKEVGDYDMLEYDEFLKWAQKFVYREKSRLQEVFLEVGEGADEVSVQQLRKLFARLGKLPFRNVVLETLESMGKNTEDALTFKEVIKFFSIFKKSEGFSTGQVSLLREAFEAFCDEDKPTVPASNFTDAMVSFFGIHVIEPAGVIQAMLEGGHILKMRDLESSKGLKPISLDLNDFLIFARKLREALFSTYQKDYPDCAWNGIYERPKDKLYMAIDVAMLHKTLNKIGYTPLAQNIEEVLNQVLLHRPEPLELDFVQFFEYLIIVRQREGFLASAVLEFRKVFNRFDDDGSGEVGALELADIFRHLGHEVVLDDLHVFLLQVDANGSGMLDFREFLRLLRLHREKELSKIKNRFERNLDTGETKLDLDGLHHSLKQIGYPKPSPMVKALQGRFKQTGVDFDQFVHCVDTCRMDKVAMQRKYAGFDEERLAEFDAAFKRLDKDNSGEINTMELTQMLQLQGWAPKTQEEQKDLVKKLDKARANAREAGIEDVGADGGSDIKFWTYVQLARILETEHEKKAEVELEELTQELGFSKDEVVEFRGIFVERKKECETELREQGVRGRIDGITATDVRRMIRIFVSRISPQDKATMDKQVQLALDGGEYIDFVHFLKFMRWLLDSGLTKGVGEKGEAGGKSS